MHVYICLSIVFIFISIYMSMCFYIPYMPWYLIFYVSVFYVFTCPSNDIGPSLPDYKGPGKLLHDLLRMKSDEPTAAVLIEGGWWVNGSKAAIWNSCWRKRILQKGKKLEGMPVGKKVAAISCSLLASWPSFSFLYGKCWGSENVWSLPPLLLLAFPGFFFLRSSSFNEGWQPLGL